MADELGKTLLHCSSVCEAMGAEFGKRQVLKLVVYFAKDEGGESEAAAEELGRLVDDRTGGTEAPKLYIEVPKLPKGGRVEIHPILHLGKGGEEELSVVVDGKENAKWAGVQGTTLALAFEEGGGLVAAAGRFSLFLTLNTAAYEKQA